MSRILYLSDIMNFNVEKYKNIMYANVFGKHNKTVKVSARL
jgi:hypothetical protein